MSVFSYRLGAINWSAMSESFVLRYFTKLSQFGLTGMCWDTHFHKYVIKATYSVENSAGHDIRRKQLKMNAKNLPIALFFNNALT